jgi:diacylglycerol O-acyltransferase / wax synthase
LPSSIPERLSALDASFLAVESPLAPMHVGWVASFDPPEDGPTTAEELIEHIATRMEGAHRYRQKLAGVPLNIHDPVWIDDPDFDPARHLHVAEGDVVDEVLSTPLARDRPLWEMWVAGDPPRIIGKAHHCMVDGLAVVELGNLLLDAEPDAPARPDHHWTPEPAPNPGQRLGRAIADRIGESAGLAAAPLRLARNVGALPGTARMVAHTLLPPAPSSPLNVRGSGRRGHLRVTRTLDDVRAIRRRFGVTPNDVVLAACAGALHRILAPSSPLKVMVPADVRSADDPAASGNRISFVFLELPCHEPDPVARIQAINRATSQRQRDKEAERLDDAFRLLALTPGPFQRTLAHAFAHPRLFNLTISSVPGPAVTRYLRGCRLREVHSAVPLSANHALSIGVVTVAGNACFGLQYDPETMPYPEQLVTALDAAFDELLDFARDA